MASIEAVVVGSGGREFEIGRQLGFADEVKTVHFLDGNAGTERLPKAENVAIHPSGGRVLYVTGVGETVDSAAKYAYAAISRIGFEGMQYRDDIGNQARKIIL